MIRRPPRSTLFPLHDALPISVEDLEGPGDRRHQSQDGAQHGGLAGPVRAYDADELAVRDFQRDVLERRAVRVPERCMVEPDQGFAVLVVGVMGMGMRWVEMRHGSLPMIAGRQ